MNRERALCWFVRSSLADGPRRADKREPYKDRFEQFSEITDDLKNQEAVAPCLMIGHGLLEKALQLRGVIVLCVVEQILVQQHSSPRSSQRDSRIRVMKTPKLCPSSADRIG
jgi:hypothetical protein